MDTLPYSVSQQTLHCCGRNLNSAHSSGWYCSGYMAKGTDVNSHTGRA